MVGSNDFYTSVFSELNCWKKIDGNWVKNVEREIKGGKWNFAFCSKRIKKKKKTKNDFIKEMCLEYMNQQDEEGKTILHYGFFFKN